MKMLSIITAVHNQIEYNKLFLEALEKYTFYPYELIIVDNASTDGSKELFASHGATVLTNASNRCYGCSQNQGLAEATGEFVAFLNNDIYLSRHWDKILIKRAREYNLDVISPCGCETLEEQSSIRRYMRKWKRISMLLRVGASAGRKYSSKDLCGAVNRMYGNWDEFTERRAKSFSHFMYPGISGFALVARRNLFDRIGLWSTRVTAADFDILLRCVKANHEGKPISQPLIAAEVFVHHFVRTTTRTVRTPYACTHPTIPIDKAYEAPDLAFMRIPSLSLIIAVHNKPEFLEKIFASLQNQTFKDFEVVIADDGSGPEIRAVLEKFQTKFSYPIRHVWQENIGFRKTAIANKAVRYSRSGYLVFVDGDCILHHRFLEDHFRSRKAGTVLSGRRVMLDEEATSKLTNADVASRRIEQPTFWLGHAHGTTGKHGFRLPVVSEVEDRWRAARLKHYCILGSNFSLFKGDYYRVNGYEEAISGRGLEDNNLSNRLKRAGVRIRTIARRAVQYHLFHSAAAIPHSKETVDIWGMPKDFWATKGIMQQQ
jgi:glycosyltransferase involved in cell wall biosynthesis